MSLTDEPSERRGLLPRFTLKDSNTFLLADALGDTRARRSVRSGDGDFDHGRDVGTRHVDAQLVERDFGRAFDAARDVDAQAVGVGLPRGAELDARLAVGGLALDRGDAGYGRQAPFDRARDAVQQFFARAGLLFGNDDQAPTAAQVNQHEEELKKHGKTYEFHRYDGAGHGFFYYDRPAYRQEQAVDGWKKVFAFLEKYLS